MLPHMSLARTYGLLRSLAMYYGVPLFRAGRMARFYAPLVPSGTLAFDIGAHVGNRVRCWRRLGARVVAVEPQADFARLLRMLFGRDPDVTVAEVALGRAPGRAALHVSVRTPTVTTLSREWIAAVSRDPSFAGVEWSTMGDVEVTTLDELIATHGRPQFIKIDVEGYETEVLAGLSTPVPAVSFEYVAATRALAVACIERLEALARYEYNWSPGERHAFASPLWLDPDGMREVLEGLTEGSGSGDVYARELSASRAAR